jgi:hypothetical protein
MQLNWDNDGGIEHAHITLRACPHRSQPAINQQSDVDAGLNGLANDGPDTGYRPLSKRSWAAGTRWMRKELAPKPVVYRIHVADDPKDFVTNAVVVRTGPGHHHPPVRNADGTVKTMRHGGKFTSATSTKTKSGTTWRRGIRKGWIPARRTRKA